MSALLAVRVCIASVVGLAAIGAAVAARPRGPAPRRILALGDSYTIGEGVPAADRWPVRLAELLRGRAPAPAAPVIVARTGWTTDELATAIAARPPRGRFDLVTLLVGVNNQYRGRDLEEFRVQFRGLLARAVTFAGGEARRVIAVSIPDWGVTPFAQGRDRARIAAEIDAFNAVAREEAARAGTRWADVTTLSRRHGADARFLVADGLHPSGAAYAEWAAVISESLDAGRAPTSR